MHASAVTHAICSVVFPSPLSRSTRINDAAKRADCAVWRADHRAQVMWKDQESIPYPRAQDTNSEYSVRRYQHLVLATERAADDRSHSAIPRYRTDWLRSSLAPIRHADSRSRSRSTHYGNACAFVI